MPKVNGAKIKSAPKNIYWTLIALVLVLIVGAIYFNRLPKTDLIATMRSNDHTYYLQVVSTMQAREKGLGGRSSMPIDQGMLFAFNNEAIRCFWMKDMRFNLDIVWLNKEKQVVYVLQNVTPASYPYSFCSEHPAQSVIELNSGQAKVAAIHIGQNLSF